MILNDPHPANALGDFYVECDSCISCEAPYAEAPDLMSRPYTSQLDHGCFFRRQPVTEDEIERACEAVWVSCVEAVRYGGTDPGILNRLYHRGAIGSCDVAYKRITKYECRAFEAYGEQIGSFDDWYWSYVSADEADRVVVSIGKGHDVRAVFGIDKKNYHATLIDDAEKYWPDSWRDRERRRTSR